MIIDLHVHCFPGELAPRALSILAQRAGTAPYFDGTVNQLRTVMDRAGIDLAVLQPIATKPEQTVGVNRWAVSAQEERVISFGTLHPDYPQWRDELKWLVEAGIKGVKFHPNYQDFYIEDPKMFPLYEAIFTAGLMALFHTGVDLWYPDSSLGHPRQLKRLLTMFPGATIIAAHMGGFRCWEAVEEDLVGTELYFDTAYSFGELGVERMGKMIRDHGVEKILFGSDAPWSDPQAEIAKLKSLRLMEEEKQLILGGNAQRLLRL
ncbi:MAG: amidohydrolase family protein [Firmicutes bacterium]|nr:amidohydrolase family protein [Bacillota bacterium]